MSGRGVTRGRLAALIAAGSIVVVAAGGWIFYGSSLLAVRSVRVTGPAGVPRARVLSAAAIKLGTPLIRISPGAIAARVDKINLVQAAQVTRSWPDAVVIAITLRTPAFAVPDRGGFAVIDGSGVILRWSAKRPRGLALLRLPATPSAAQASPRAVAAAARVLRGLPSAIRGLVTAVSAPTATAITLYLRDGVTVRWGGTDRMAAKAAELTVLLRTRTRYYDISDPVTAVTSP